MSDDVVFGDCLDCGAQWAYGARVHADDCAYMRPTRVRQRPVSRTAPTEPPPPYSAMPAKPVAHAHAFHREHLGDRIACSICGVTVDVANVRALGLVEAGAAPDPYDRVRNELADTAGRLRSENTALLAENSRLRRDVERLTRKAGGR